MSREYIYAVRLKCRFTYLKHEFKYIDLSILMEYGRVELKETYTLDPDQNFKSEKMRFVPILP